MNSTRTAVSRCTRATGLAVVAAAAVTALVWAPSAGSTGAAPGASAPGAAESETLVLTGAEADPFALTDSGPRPLPGRLPAELREDLRELRAMEPEQRREAAERIRRDALSGAYGPRVRQRAVEARHRFLSLPEELREDLKELRGLDGDALREARDAIRDKALDGGYGPRAERWAEHRAEHRAEHHRRD